MNGGAYYNEIDAYAAQWLRNLIAAGHIAAGDVDERSITEVHPDDLRGYTQCHFFAGIGGWSYALRLAGWPDDRSVWTGSCPCQPFSAAGRQRGSDDERHLWPAFFRLIGERRPGTVFGEQVAGAAGLAWWDHVAADLESADYAAAAANLGAHSVGAPHLRQRLYWVADAGQEQRGRRPREWRPIGEDAAQWHEEAVFDQRCCAAGELADDEGNGRREGCAHASRRDEGNGAEGPRLRSADGCGGLLADATEPRSQGRDEPGQRSDAQRAAVERGGALGACCARHAGAYAAVCACPWRPWQHLEWIACSDGKARPTEPGLQPLAHGVSGRVGRLRAYGNAIVPQVAAAFIRAASPTVAQGGEG